MRVVALVIGAVVVVGAGVAGVRIFDKPPPAVASDGPEAARTVAIVRRDLSQSKEHAGQLGYGDSTTVKGRAAGTITWLPEPGATLGRGDVLYRVDDKPVVLLYGGTPLFRSIGKPPLAGPDVKVLKENLTALGFLPPTTTDKLTEATIRAIEEWQKSLELDASGVIDPGTVVVLPGPVRVDSVKAALGDAAAQADVLGVTATEKVVTMAVDADSTEGIGVGVKVKLGLPNGKNTAGVIRAVGTDVTESSDGEKKPQVVATIRLADQAAAGGVDSGSVTVTVPGATRKGVLVVPVAALLALREGGYAVQVVEGTSTQLVGVKTGMFADGNVEITGAGLREGLKVVTTS